MTPALPLRRRPDLETAPGDGRVQELLNALRALPVDRERSTPQVEFRSELRAQLVSIAPRILAESAAEESEDTSVVRPTRGRRHVVGRIALVATSAACLVVLLTAALVALSGSALPGDALYRVKRTAEDVRLSLANGDLSSARVYLSEAQTRSEEITKLLHRTTSMSLGPGVSASGSLSKQTVNRIESAFRDADSETQHGSWLLTEYAVVAKKPAVLDVMAAWAPQQAQRLAAVVGRLPEGPARQSATESLNLVRRADRRTTELQRVFGQPCVSSKRSDALGPLACSDPSGSSGAAGSSPSTSPSGPPSSPSGTTSGASPSVPASGSPSAPGGASGGVGGSGGGVPGGGGSGSSSGSTAGPSLPAPPVSSPPALPASGAAPVSSAVPVPVSSAPSVSVTVPPAGSILPTNLPSTLPPASTVAPGSSTVPIPPPPTCHKHCGHR